MELTKTFTLRLYMPFRITASPVLFSGEERRSRIQSIVSYLREQELANVEYRTEDYTVEEDKRSGTYPGFLKRKKDPGIVGTATPSSRTRELVESLYDSFTLEDIREVIRYWDWGVAISELQLEFSFDQPQDLLTINDWTNPFHERLQQERPLILQQHLDEFRDALLNEQDSPIQKSDFLNLETGIMSGVCFCSELSQSGDETIDVDEDQLKTIFSALAHTNAEEVVFQRHGIFECIVSGIGSQVLLETSDPVPETLYQRDRARWLFRLLIFNWNNLHQISRALYDTLKTTQGYMNERVTLQDLDHRMESLSLNLLITEAKPANIVRRLFDEKIYGENWDAWSTDGKIELINERKDFIRQFLQESLNLVDSEKQSRINKVLLLLNVITFASVLAAVISVYELQGQYFQPMTRVEWIVAGTILFGLLSSVFVFLGRKFD